MNFEIKNIADLKPHEEILDSRLEEIISQITETKVIDYPVIIDEKTFTILDGHHRFNACIKLNIQKIPVLIVDYSSSEIEINSWRIGENFSKEEVLQIAESGKLLPHKSTKHSYKFEIPKIDFCVNI